MTLLFIVLLVSIMNASLYSLELSNVTFPEIDLFQEALAAPDCNLLEIEAVLHRPLPESLVEHSFEEKLPNDFDIGANLANQCIVQTGDCQGEIQPLQLPSGGIQNESPSCDIRSRAYRKRKNPQKFDLFKQKDSKKHTNKRSLICLSQGLFVRVFGPKQVEAYQTVLNQLLQESKTLRNSNMPDKSDQIVAKIYEIASSYCKKNFSEKAYCYSGVEPSTLRIAAQMVLSAFYGQFFTAHPENIQDPLMKNILEKINAQ